MYKLPLISNLAESRLKSWNLQSYVDGLKWQRSSRWAEICSLNVALAEAFSRMSDLLRHIESLELQRETKAKEIQEESVATRDRIADLERQLKDARNTISDLQSNTLPPAHKPVASPKPLPPHLRNKHQQVNQPPTSPEKPATEPAADSGTHERPPTPSNSS